MGACGRDAALLLHTHSHISPPSLHSATAVPRSYTLTRLSVCKCLQRNMSSNSIGAVRCDACMGHPAVALSSSPTRTCHVVTNISHVAIFSCISCPCGTTQTSLHPAAPHRPHARWTMVMIAPVYTHLNGLLLLRAPCFLMSGQHAPMLVCHRGNVDHHESTGCRSVTRSP